MTTYEQHPLAKKYIPQPTDAELARLRDSIREDGYDENYPVFLFEGMVLVGWTRSKASSLENVEPYVLDYTGGEPLAFMRRSELDRRQMSVVQRLRICDSMREELAEEAKLRQGRSVPAGMPELEVDSRIASEAGTSERTARNYHAVQTNGTPELIEAMHEEEVTITDAAETAKHPPAIQRAAVKAVKSGKSKTAAKAAHDANGRPVKKPKKAKKPPTPKAVLKDQAGNVIPDNLRDAFADTGLPSLVADVELAESVVKGESWVTKAGKLSEHYPFLLISSFDKHISDAVESLQKAVESLKAGMPFAVCPRCHGEAREAVCRTCRGCGHVPESRYMELSDDA